MLYLVPDRVLTWIGGIGSLTAGEKEIVGRGQGMTSCVGNAASTIMLGQGRGTTMGLGMPPSLLLIRRVDTPTRT
jgi:hypothetical protein